jgi:MOSC domain-containing protein YiiM
LRSVFPRRERKFPKKFLTVSYVMPNKFSVVAVAAAKDHSFHKNETNAIRLIAGRGIHGDAHCGARVQHLYDQAKDASQPNLRQVHLLESELLEHLQTLGFEIMPGQLGENITTRNLRLIDLYAGARVRVGAKSVIEITGLREPCVKIERFKKGLRAAVTARRGAYAYMKSAVMAAVIESGTVYAGDEIDVIDGAGRGIPLSLV